MRFLALIEYSAVIVGIIAVIAGRFFALAKGFHLGVFLIGTGIALGGLESIVTRRMGFRASDDSYQAYAGTPAMIVGLMALLVGTGLIATAYVLADGLWYSTVHYLTRRPAPVLIATGLLLIGIGVLIMLNPRGRRGLPWTILVRVPRSLLGLVLVVGGLAGIGLGVWEWREPLAFDRFIRNLPQKLDKLHWVESGPRRYSLTGQQHPFTGPLFDHPVGANENRLLELEAERACRLEINHQLEHGWLLEWRLARLLSFKNTINENRGVAEVRLASVQ